MLLSDRKGVKTVKQLSRQATDTEEREKRATKFIAQLRKFDNIGGYSGVSEGGREGSSLQQDLVCV